MQLGVVGYVREVERRPPGAAHGPRGHRAGAHAGTPEWSRSAALDEVVDASPRRPAATCAAGEPVSDVTYRFQRGSEASRREWSRADLGACRPTSP